jgi:hypothetical protein
MEYDSGDFSGGYSTPATKRSPTKIASRGRPAFSSHLVNAITGQAEWRFEILNRCAFTSG